MQWSISRQNKRRGSRLVALLQIVSASTLITLALAGCELGVFDRSIDADDGTSGETVTLNITIPTGSLGASEVTAETVTDVRIIVRRPDGSGTFASKSVESGPDDTFTLEVQVPVNTTIRIEAVGFTADGDVVAYGRRELTVEPVVVRFVSLSLITYRPTTLAIPAVSTLTLPPAAAQNGMLSALVSGSVSTGEWPDDPDGLPLESLELDVRATVDDGSTDGIAAGSWTEELRFENASGGLISFSDIPLSFATSSAGSSADEFSCVLALELTPGGTLEVPFTLDLMAPVTSVTAVAGDNQIALSWTNPTGAWFDGVAVIASTAGIPQNATDGTEIYRGTGTTATHSQLVNGTNVNYAIFPFTETGGVYAYGPATRISATPFDGAAPAAPSGFTASLSGNTVNLSWSNPSDSDLAEIIVLYRSDTYAQSASDAQAVRLLSGTTSATSAVDTLTQSGTRYYSVYARDDDDNYSTPATQYVTYTAAPSGSGTAIRGYNYGELTTSDARSVSSSSKYADVWTFTLTYTATVTIGMDGYYGYPDFDTYLYLYTGSVPNSTNRITYNDDSGYNGYGLNSRIVRTLGPGTYSIEATHYGSDRTGQYELYVWW